jgi:hypothetical protein
MNREGELFGFVFINVELLNKILNLEIFSDIDAKFYVYIKVGANAP